MYRIDALGHDENHFSDGSPTASIPLHASMISADLLNAVQREIVNVLEKSGKTLHISTEAIADMDQLVDCVGQSYATFSTGASGSATITQKNCQNVSSIVRNDNGSYTINLTRSYANANYAISIGLGKNGVLAAGEYDFRAFVINPTVNSFTILVVKKGGTYVQFDGMRISVRVTGSVA